MTTAAALARSALPDAPVEADRARTRPSAFVLLCALLRPATGHDAGRDRTGRCSPWSAAHRSIAVLATSSTSGTTSRPPGRRTSTVLMFDAHGRPWRARRSMPAPGPNSPPVPRRRPAGTRDLPTTPDARTDAAPDRRRTDCAAQFVQRQPRVVAVGPSDGHGLIGVDRDIGGFRTRGRRPVTCASGPGGAAARVWRLALLSHPHSEPSRHGHRQRRGAPLGSSSSLADRRGRPSPVRIPRWSSAEQTEHVPGFRQDCLGDRRVDRSPRHPVRTWLLVCSPHHLPRVRGRRGRSPVRAGTLRP